MQCPSVRLSVTFVNYVKTNKHIYKFFSPSGSQTIPVFFVQTSWQYSDGDPSKGGVEYMWGRHKWRFWTIAGYRSMTAAMRDQQLTVVGAVVYNSYDACPFTAETATHQ